MSCYHITSTEKGWELRKQGATRPSKTAPDKARILELTRTFMEKKAGTVKVHGEDGTLEEELTYT